MPVLGTVYPTPTFSWSSQIYTLKFSCDFVYTSIPLTCGIIVLMMVKG